MNRPNPAQWLWYAYGGRLPDRYRDWVRYDTTSRRWLARHVIRIVVEALPVLVIAFVLLCLYTSVSPWVVGGALMMGLAIVLFMTTGSARDMTLVRLARHGFRPDVRPPPTALLPEDAGRDRHEREQR